MKKIEFAMLLLAFLVIIFPCRKEAYSFAQRTTPYQNAIGSWESLETKIKNFIRKEKNKTMTLINGNTGQKYVLKPGAVYHLGMHASYEPSPHTFTASPIIVEFHAYSIFDSYASVGFAYSLVTELLFSKRHLDGQGIDLYRFAKKQKLATIRFSKTQQLWEVRCY